MTANKSGSARRWQEYAGGDRKKQVPLPPAWRGIISVTGRPLSRALQISKKLFSRSSAVVHAGHIACLEYPEEGGKDKDNEDHQHKQAEE